MCVFVFVCMSNYLRLVWSGSCLGPVKCKSIFIYTLILLTLNKIIEYVLQRLDQNS